MSKSTAQHSSDSRFSSTKEDLREQARTVADDVKEFGAISKQAAADGAQAAADRAVQAKDDAAEKASDLMDRLVSDIRREPIKAVLIAAGVGAVASMWLRRK